MGGRQGCEVELLIPWPRWGHEKKNRERENPSDTIDPYFYAGTQQNTHITISTEMQRK